MCRSPFLRNIEVVIALLFGYFIAWLTRHHGDKFVVSNAFQPFILATSVPPCAPPPQHFELPCMQLALAECR